MRQLDRNLSSDGPTADNLCEYELLDKMICKYQKESEKKCGTVKTKAPWSPQLCQATLSLQWVLRCILHPDKSKLPTFLSLELQHMESTFRELEKRLSSPTTGKAENYQKYNQKFRKTTRGMSAPESFIL